MRENRFDEIIERLREWKETLSELLKEPASGTEGWTLKLQIEDAIACLRLCETHRIHPRSKVIKLPDPRTMSPSCEYRLMEDQESDRRTDWIEVLMEGEPIRPTPGSLLIEPDR